MSSKFSAYRCLVFGAVWEVGGRWEFLSKHYSRSENEHLTDWHDTTSRVIKWQWAVINIIVFEVGDDVNCRCDVNVSRVSDDSSLGESGSARCVNVEKLIMMIWFFDFICWRWISGNLSHDWFQVFWVAHHWQVDVVIELVKHNVRWKLITDFFDGWCEN